MLDIIKGIFYGLVIAAIFAVIILLLLFYFDVLKYG